MMEPQMIITHRKMDEMLKSIHAEKLAKLGMTPNDEQAIKAKFRQVEIDCFAGAIKEFAQ